jgi:hypothetical protein
MRMELAIEGLPMHGHAHNDECPNDLCGVRYSVDVKRSEHVLVSLQVE